MPELNHHNKVIGHSSHYEDLQEKAIPVTIAGLYGSGKTSILNCLLDRMDPQGNEEGTLGLTATTIEIEQTRLRLIDLGGKEAFRDLLWETYVKIAEGLVFVVDATNVRNLDLARDWFWRIVDWGNKQAPILLLINQRDNESKTLGIDEITAQFELERFSEVPARPIRILEVSVAKEDSVRHSFGWLVEKLQARVQSQALKVRSLSFYGRDGAPIVDPVFFGHTNDLNSLYSLIEKFGTLSFAKTADLGLQTLTVGEHRIMLIKGDQVSCAILIRKSDSQERAKIVTEELIGYVEDEFIEKGKKITAEVISEFMSRKFALFLAI